jgi:hypothetical protein
VIAIALIEGVSRGIDPACCRSGAAPRAAPVEPGCYDQNASQA